MCSKFLKWVVVSVLVAAGFVAFQRYQELNNPTWHNLED